MRKRLLLIMLSLLPMVLTAGVLTPEEALGRLGKSGPARMPAITGKGTKLQRTIKAKGTGEAAVYVFKTGNGSMIMSADDAAPAVLGYTQGDLSEIPANMEAWLQLYADEIAWLRESGESVGQASAGAVRPTRAPIDPMVSTRWGQAEPYNNMCPVDPNSTKGARCVSGCVATAMAQVLNWHQWPKTGRGTHTYAWNEQDMAFNYGATTFDWDNMLDIYKDVEATQAQQDAVATLMLACGIGIDMQYSSSGSGAYGNEVPIPIYKYFCYDEHVNYAARSFYTKYEWEDLIYDQLSKVGPVMVSGASSGGGHEFVCDGYSEDGYFHFNWGWNGLSDGYFLFTTLDPQEQGIGGGSKAGFIYNVGAVVGMSKDYIPGQKASVWRGTTASTLSPMSASGGAQVTFGMKVVNQGFRETAPTIGLAVVKEDDTLDVLGQATSTTSLKNGEEVKVSAKFNLPATYADGEYIVVPAVLEDDGLWRPLPVTQTLKSKYSMTVSNGQYAFTLLDPAEAKGDVKLTAVEFPEKPLAKEPVHVKLTIQNPEGGTWEYPLYIGVLYPENDPRTGIIWLSEKLNQEFEGNETKVLEYDLDFSGLGPGDYRIGCYTHSKLYVSLGLYARCGDMYNFSLWGEDPVTFSISGDALQVEPGKSITIPVTATPDDAETRATWTSSNPEVATVDNSGVVTGVSLGETTITAVSCNGISSTRKVNVVDRAVRGFPAVVNDVIYDYTDESHTALKAVSPDDKNLRSKYAVLESEIDGIPVTTLGANFCNTMSVSPQSLVIPEGYTTIENEALKGSYIYSVSLPSTITSIGTNSIYSTSLKKLFNNMPASVKLSTGGFRDATTVAVYVKEAAAASGLTKAKVKVYPELGNIFTSDDLIYIPTSDKTCDLVDYVYKGSATTTINIPEQVTGKDGKIREVQSINDYAMYWSYYLNTLSIPFTVKSIGASVAYVAKVKDLYCYISSPSAVNCDSKAFDVTSGTPSGTVHVYEDAVEAYQNAAPWNTWGNIVGMPGKSGPYISTDPANLVMRTGETKHVSAAGSPVTYFTEALSWSSSDNLVATVTENGDVTAMGIGEATVTVSANGISAEINVKVVPEATIEFPTKIDNITYDYADASHTTLMVTDYDGSISKYRATIKDEVDNLPVVKIGACAFRGKWPRRIDIPESVTEIGDSAFMSSHVQSIIIPSKVTKVGYRALYSSYLRKIFCLSAAPIQYKNAGLMGTDALTIYTASEPALKEFYDSKYAVYPRLAEIFEDERGLSYIPVGEDEACLADYMYGATGKALQIPQEVTAPDGSTLTVTSIAKYALMSNNHTSMYIPGTVNEIGLNAFAKNSYLTSVTCDIMNPGTVVTGSGIFDDVKIASATLTVPKGRAVVYSSTPQWEEFGTINEYIPTGVENVPESGTWVLSGNEIVLPAGERCVIYDVSGHVLYAGSGEYRFGAKGLYLITISGKTYKVLVR